MTTRGYSQVVHGGSDAGGDPAEVWTWTDDLAPDVSDERTWYAMLVDARGQHVSRADVTVYWSVTVGTATLSASSTTTDARGIATVTVTYTDAGAVTITGSLT